MEVVARDPVKDVRQLKTETGKGIQLVGGAEPAGALHHIKVNPVTAATGIPLVAGKNGAGRRRFALTDHMIPDSGVAILTYRTAPAPPPDETSQQSSAKARTYRNGSNKMRVLLSTKNREGSGQ
ncbi:hypothetical protein ACFLIM_25215 [Nonomuraea sp. M3C6]|uniref:Uncharacterized protein n=1 Tax=Nonomuraea marmarensis TaxID=3351344 RepID=A0ABW7AHH9_9ACTN